MSRNSTFVSGTRFFLMLTIAVVTSTDAQAATFRTVVLSGDPAPGTEAGTEFFTFSSTYPVINAQGQVAFEAWLAGPSVNNDNDRGIFSESSGALDLVIREDVPAPGTETGTEFASFFDPLYADDGSIGLHGFLRGPGVVLNENHIGVWSGSAGTLTLLARLGSQAPGLATGTNFSVFNSHAYGHNGHIAFFSLLTGTGVDSTNYRSLWSDSSGTLTLLARMGSQAPGTDPGVVFEHFSPPVVNGSGLTAFRATVSGPGVDNSNSLGIWSDGFGSLLLVARAGDFAVGAGPGVFFADFNNIEPTINDAGDTAFHVGLNGAGVDDTNDRGIWSQTSGELAMIAREGDQAPGTCAGTVFSEVFIDEIPFFPGDPFFLTFRGPIQNAVGHTSFVAGLSGPDVDETNHLGIWSEGSGTLELVARTGDVAPGVDDGAEFVFFGSIPINPINMNANGDVAFMGVLVGDGVDFSNNIGIWAQKDGELQLVIRAGDEIEVAPGDIRTASWPGILSGSGREDGREVVFNDAGQIAMTLFFTDDTSGVFVATLETPTGACCFGNGFCTVQTQQDCEAAGDQLYAGHGTECVGDLTCPSVCQTCLCADGFQELGDSAIGCVAEENECNEVCKDRGGVDSFACELGSCEITHCADIDNNGDVNFDDIFKTVLCFQAHDDCPMTCGDISPCGVGNGVCNFDDIQCAVREFQGTVPGC